MPKRLEGPKSIDVARVASQSTRPNLIRDLCAPIKGKPGELSGAERKAGNRHFRNGKGPITGDTGRQPSARFASDHVCHPGVWM